MIIPVRCFSCGKPLGDCWSPYLIRLEQGMAEGCARPSQSAPIFELTLAAGKLSTHSGSVAGAVGG